MQITYRTLSLDTSTSIISTDDGAATRLAPLCSLIAQECLKGGTAGQNVFVIRARIPMMARFGRREILQATRALSAQLNLIDAYVAETGDRVFIRFKGGLPNLPSTGSPPVPPMVAA